MKRLSVLIDELRSRMQQLVEAAQAQGGNIGNVVGDLVKTIDFFVKNINILKTKTKSNKFKNYKNLINN